MRYYQRKMFCFTSVIFFFCFRGAHKYTDVITMGGNQEKAKILEMQNEVQFDDPVNIQFTSVSV